jgi:hypothetical protein
MHTFVSRKEMAHQWQLCLHEITERTSQQINSLDRFDSLLLQWLTSFLILPPLFSSPLVLASPREVVYCFG